MSLLMLKLSLCIVAVIQMTSSGPVYEPRTIQRRSDEVTTTPKSAESKILTELAEIKAVINNLSGNFINIFIHQVMVETATKADEKLAYLANKLMMMMMIIVIVIVIAPTISNAP